MSGKGSLVVSRLPPRWSRLASSSSNALRVGEISERCQDFPIEVGDFIVGLNPKRPIGMGQGARSRRVGPSSTARASKSSPHLKTQEFPALPALTVPGSLT